MSFLGNILSSIGIQVTIGKQPEQAPQVPPQNAIPMSNDEARALALRVKETFPFNQQAELLKLAALTNYFTSAQVAFLLQAVSWDKDKLPVFPHLIRRVTDRNNIYTTLTGFTFGSYRKLASRILQEEVRG